MDRQKIAFSYFLQRIEKGEVAANREHFNIMLRKEKTRTMFIWDNVINASLDVKIFFLINQYLESSRNALVKTMTRPFLTISIKESMNASVLENEIRYSNKLELDRIEKLLLDIDFTVNFAYNYYKLVRSIEGAKYAGVRVLKAVNMKIDKMLAICGSATYKKSLQNDLQRQLALVNNDKKSFLDSSEKQDR